MQVYNPSQVWVPQALMSAPLPPLGLHRDLSAPVKLRYEYSDEDLAFLMKHDTDSFNRWEAGQQVPHSIVGGVPVRVCCLLSSFCLRSKRNREANCREATVALPGEARPP